MSYTAGATLISVNYSTNHLFLYLSSNVHASHLFIPQLTVFHYGLFNNFVRKSAHTASNNMTISVNNVFDMMGNEAAVA